MKSAVLVCLLLVGCAATAPPGPPAAKIRYEHRVSDSHVEVSWNCEQPHPEILEVIGELRNSWDPGPIRFAELELVGVNAQGRSVGAARGPVQDVLVHTNQSSPFRLAVRTTGSEARVDLYYQYRHRADDSGLPARFGDTFQRSYVRDACRPDAHRAG